MHGPFAFYLPRADPFKKASAWAWQNPWAGSNRHAPDPATAAFLLPLHPHLCLRNAQNLKMTHNTGIPCALRESGLSARTWLTARFCFLYGRNGCRQTRCDTRILGSMELGNGGEIPVIACDECKKEYSEQAKACVHCGARNPNKMSAGGKFGVAILVIVGLFVAFLVIGNLSYNSSGGAATGAQMCSQSAEAVLPVYRIECIFGFVVGMTFTFGAVLPTLVAVVFAAVSVVAHFIFRAVMSAIRPPNRQVQPNSSKRTATPPLNLSGGR